MSRTSREKERKRLRARAKRERDRETDREQEWEMALFMRNSMFKRWCRKFTKKLHSARFKEWVKWSTPCPCESHRMSQLYCTLQQTHPACSKWGQSVNSGRWLAKDVITLLLQKWWGHWIRTCHNVKWCGGKVVNFISRKFRPFFFY